MSIWPVAMLTFAIIVQSITIVNQSRWISRLSSRVLALEYPDQKAWITGTGRRTTCINCERPLPRRRWWQVIPSPPFCRPEDEAECAQLLWERIGGKGEYKP